jgi:hypothetical protein
MNKLYILLACCCCSSSAGAGGFFGGFIPNTQPWMWKTLKKLTQNVITGDAKPVDCANLYKFLIKNDGTGGKGQSLSAHKSISEKDEKWVIRKVYEIGRDIEPEKICDKSIVDSSIALFKKVQNAPEGEDVSKECNELKDLGNENKDKKHPIYYWDESKKEFIEDRIYFSNAIGDEKPIIAKCMEAGINIR